MREAIYNFLASAIEAERLLLACGWRDAQALHEHSADASLCAADFVLDDHSKQFAYLCRCYELCVWPTTEQLQRVTTIDLGAIDSCLWVDYRPQLIGTYVETVKDNAERRRMAREHMRSAAMLMGDDVATLDLSESAAVTLKGKHIIVITERDRLSIDEAKKLCEAMRLRSKVIVAPCKQWTPESDELIAML